MISWLRQEIPRCTRNDGLSLYRMNLESRRVSISTATRYALYTKNALDCFADARNDYLKNFVLCRDSLS